MKIVIEAHPERMTTMAFFDGMDNQLFPPMHCKIDEITNIVKSYCDEADINEVYVGGNAQFAKHIAEKMQTEFTTIDIKLI